LKSSCSDLTSEKCLDPRASVRPSPPPSLLAHLWALSLPSASVSPLSVPLCSSLHLYLCFPLSFSPFLSCRLSEGRFLSLLIYSWVFLSFCLCECFVSSIHVSALSVSLSLLLPLLSLCLTRAFLHLLRPPLRISPVHLCTPHSAGSHA